MLWNFHDCCKLIEYLLQNQIRFCGILCSFYHNLLLKLWDFESPILFWWIFFSRDLLNNVNSYFHKIMSIISGLVLFCLTWMCHCFDWSSELLNLCIGIYLATKYHIHNNACLSGYFEADNIIHFYSDFLQWMSVTVSLYSSL